MFTLRIDPKAVTWMYNNQTIKHDQQPVWLTLYLICISSTVTWNVMKGHDKIWTDLSSTGIEREQWENSGGPLSALTQDSYRAIKKISPSIYSLGWVGSWVSYFTESPCFWNAWTSPPSTRPLVYISIPLCDHPCCPVCPHTLLSSYAAYAKTLLRVDYWY